MGSVTAAIGRGVDFALNSPYGYNAFAGSLNSEVAIAPMTPGFGEMMKAFFGGIDDAIVYIFSD